MKTTTFNQQLKSIIKEFANSCNVSIRKVDIEFGGAGFTLRCEPNKTTVKTQTCYIFDNSIAFETIRTFID